MDVGKGREHDHMDVGGRTASGTVVEERKLIPLSGVHSYLHPRIIIKQLNRQHGPKTRPTGNCNHQDVR